MNSAAYPLQNRSFSAAFYTWSAQEIRRFSAGFPHDFAQEFITFSRTVFPQRFRNDSEGNKQTRAEEKWA